MQKVEEKSLSETTFAVLDLETSGGSPRLGAGITEIGVVKVKGGEILGTFQSFVDPGHSLPVFITQLTGISDEMLISAPFIDEILPTLFEFLGSAEETVVVAPLSSTFPFNVAEFVATDDSVNVVAIGGPALIVIAKVFEAVVPAESVT